MRLIFSKQLHSHGNSTILVFFALFLPSRLLAQPCNSSPIQKGISQTVHVFVVGVVVHDKKGNSVGGLRATDFVVLADGRQQTVVAPQSVSDFTSFAERITAETGGEVLSVHKRDDFGKAFAALKEDLANVYLVDFSPS